MVGQVAALYLPGSPEPSSVDIPGLDKVVHVALFAVPAFLLRRLTSAWWPLALLALHAPVSELVQWRFIAYRSGDWWDLVADLVGVALGWAVGRRAESGHGRTARSHRAA